MKLIMRLCQPEEGNIFIGGRDISEYTEKELRNKNRISRRLLQLF